MQRQKMDEAGSLQRVVPEVVFATEEARQRAIQGFIVGSAALPSVVPLGAAAVLVQPCSVAWYQPAEAMAAASWQPCSMVRNLQPATVADVTVTAAAAGLQPNLADSLGRAKHIKQRLTVATAALQVMQLAVRLHPTRDAGWDAEALSGVRVMRRVLWLTGSWHGRIGGS
jgi:hypothetical protein